MAALPNFFESLLINFNVRVVKDGGGIQTVICHTVYNTTV
jgi:hypothetical protein